jgi:DNA polymerase-1
MTLRGVRVDTDLVAERAAREEAQKRGALEELAGEGLPLSRSRTMRGGEERVTVFDSPFATTEGIAWLTDLWCRHGVTNPPRTPKGRLSTKVDAMTRIMDNPRCPEELRRILDLMCTANGARVVYATVAKHLVGDRVHPVMSPEQASGRLSITRPGLTVFGKHGGKVRERGIFLPEEGHVMVAFDFDQIDARAVAAHCQDHAYMDLFEGDTDFHTANAVAVFGDASYREVAKKAGHGENYGMGAASMAKLIIGATGMSPDDAREQAQRYLDVVAEAYPDRNRWRANVREMADRGVLLDNGFGRMMRPEVGRGWTQGPALMGQGTTRDLMVAAILRMDPEVRRTILFTVHDEIVCSIPADRVDDHASRIMDAMTFDWAPPGAGRPIRISCGRSAAGANWAACYGK